MLIWSHYRLQEVKSQPQNFVLDALFNDPWTNAFKYVIFIIFFRTIDICRKKKNWYFGILFDESPSVWILWAKTFRVDRNRVVDGLFIISSCLQNMNSNFQTMWPNMNLCFEKSSSNYMYFENLSQNLSKIFIHLPTLYSL